MTQRIARPLHISFTQGQRRFALTPSPAMPPISTLREFEAAAQAALPPAHWAYFDGTAADGLTRERNEAAWQHLRLLPRVLTHTAGGHTRRPLLGRELTHPVLLAPVATLRLAHPDGEVGMACAAAAQQTGMVLSSQSSTRLEEVAQAIVAEPDRGPLWMQLYLQPDRGFTRELVQRAEAAGFEALVLTVDAPVQGSRDMERRIGFQLPPDVSAVNLQNQRPPAPRPRQAHHSLLFDELLHHAPTWDDLDWLKAFTRLPVLLKGVLHPDDAAQARHHGADGVIVSNHGGRTLDTAVSTAWALPRIVEAAGPEWPVLVDGGIRRGTDVLKAIALGAHAVLIGRPAVQGLAAGGAAGVAQTIKLLRDELEIAMALCGCRTLNDVKPSLLVGSPLP